MPPEYRQDPLSGRWVIIATGRANRPQEVGALASAPVLRQCPFCLGDEQDTPGEILAVRAPHLPPNGPGWRVRVVPNKYPAVVAEGWEDVASGRSAALSFPGNAQPGLGVHEVIVESPQHLLSDTEQTPAALAEVLWVYRERLRAFAGDGRWRYGLIFKNVGFAAGASLEHLHSQAVALPIVPSAIVETLTSTADFYQQHRRCYYCDLLQCELAAETRIIAATEHFVALCPYAARYAYETWILPRRHQAAFPFASEAELAGLAEMLHTALRKLGVALDKPAYNYAIRTAPFDSSSAEHYHWHIEIFPRITRLAGFELSTDFYINVVRPEEAASVLRTI